MHFLRKLFSFINLIQLENIIPGGICTRSDNILFLKMLNGLFNLVVPSLNSVKLPVLGILRHQKQGAPVYAFLNQYRLLHLLFAMNVFIYKRFTIWNS